MMKKRKIILITLMLMAMSLPATVVAASPRLAVLDFELNDMTQLPRVPAELARVATLGPLVREAITNLGRVEVVPVPAEAYAKAKRGLEGYLFQHPEEAATMGKDLGVDWVAITELYKTSFLYAYLHVILVHVPSGLVAGETSISPRGLYREGTERAAQRMAETIDLWITHKTALSATGP